MFKDSFSFSLPVLIRPALPSVRLLHSAYSEDEAGSMLGALAEALDLKRVVEGIAQLLWGRKKTFRSRLLNPEHLVRDIKEPRKITNRC